MTTPDSKPVVWQAKPSQWAVAHIYLACAALGILSLYGAWVLPSLLPDSETLNTATHYTRLLLVAAAIGALLYSGIVWINLRYTRYSLTEDTLYTRLNFFFGHHDTLWVHIIRDVRAEIPLYLRPLRLGNVVIESLDRSHPKLVLRAVRRPQQIKNLLNDLARQQAVQHGIRAVDTGG